MSIGIVGPVAGDLELGQIHSLAICGAVVA